VDTEPGEKAILRLITPFYLAMSAVGLTMILWRNPGKVFDPLNIPGERPAVFFLLVVALTALVHAISRAWHHYSPRARQCAEDLRLTLGKLSPANILWVALFSGFGEELLFRGWILNETGLPVSSILFGLIHFPPNRNWLLWPLFAAGLGFILGALCLYSGTLLWAVLLHAAINYVNLSFILRR